ncbi:Vacuolar protein sorting-associated protein 9a [Leucoagaricus sp. SymC.cos]|nr:Vacuolar protein sorting-associated protein 9a [Leucoagaricus sp. SymC.cos]
MSLDVAKPIASPATLLSFAAQQEQRPGGTEDGRSPGNGGGSNGNGTKPAEGQFDFQKFLDQMKTRSAEPVSKYLRSFLSNFAKRTFTVNDQIKIINDFLNFISGQMRSCDVWKNASNAEFDNAMEGMEKLVMNRLYDFTFTPQVSRANPPRPVTTDDLERDRVLSQRIALFGWLEEKHLDVPTGEGSKGFMMFAQQELLKINHYKAPRDKLICILNCCKVIFGLLRHLKKDEGADSFVPILIFVVLKANPDHLLSNVEFINRFRNPAKLQSEAGYYLSSLMGAVSFIETMDHTSLSDITQEEFET